MMTPTTSTSEATVTVPILFCAIDVGESKWHLSFTVAAGQRPRRRVITAGDLTRFEQEILNAQTRFQLPASAVVVSCYEAGRTGFWLHRWLVRRGGDNVVVDSASIEVNRRARRTKTDRVDGDKLLQQLIRDRAGEPNVWSAVHVPTVEEEDGRHLHRELETVKTDRTRVLNRIHGLLATYGLRWDAVKDLPKWLATAATWDGRPLPTGLSARLMRDWGQLETLEARVAEIEDARIAQLRQADDPMIAQVRQLMELRGIGINGAWLLVKEIFGWRDIRNRRQLGALAGLVGTPYNSGDSVHDQGISKAGNRHVRWMMVQLAWGWIRYQPDSALTRWFQ
jgi:transposase